jgi:hypothetical protein
MLGASCQLLYWRVASDQALAGVSVRLLHTKLLLADWVQQTHFDQGLPRY